jgi:hypothetical protein
VFAQKAQKEQGTCVRLTGGKVVKMDGSSIVAAITPLAPGELTPDTHRREKLGIACWDSRGGDFRLKRKGFCGKWRIFQTSA